MHALTALFIAISILELTIWFPGLWEFRKFIALPVLVLLTFVSFGFVIFRPSLVTLAIAVLSFYRVVNLFRLIKSRIHIHHLYKTTYASSISIISLQLFVLVAMFISDKYAVSGTTWLYILTFVQVIAGVVVYKSTIRHLKTTKPIDVAKYFTDKELPTVTVAIPARNETNNLRDCLNSLILSNYPKLEIIVLDDCSQDRRTPEIIRDFALRGVRFIAGKEPPDKWLAKNYAYKQLVDESSGELIIFCGVDTRFEPNTIKSLVEISLLKNKHMISIIPANKQTNENMFLQLIIQPSRYAWELTLPRKLLNRPPVLSTCWMIQRDLLLSSGGFEAVSNTISPESYFARCAIAANDGYSFMQADYKATLVSVKSIDDQKDTAIRTRYPQLHKKPEITGIVTIAEFGTLILPIILVAFGFATANLLILFLASISVYLQHYSFGKIVDLTYRNKVKFGYLILPFAALYDLILLNTSMLRYEFGEVIWKDRNVCIPIMDVRSGITKPRSY